MKRSQGFTIIELLVAGIFLMTAAVVLIFQTNRLHDEFNNKQKRTAINAIHYALEEGFYKQYGYYPEVIDAKKLTAIDPELLKDLNGVMIGDPTSDYLYESKNCQQETCKAYSLRARLVNEDDYVKESRTQ